MEQPDVYVWTRKLQNFEPILERWIQLVGKATEAWYRDEEPDCPWWYGERSSVGLLAAAAWMEEGEALEAYPEEKGEGNEAYPGRTDLYISHRSDEYVFEAKQLWLDLSKPNEQLIKATESKLESALKDVRKNTEPVEHKFGIVFVKPSFKDIDPPTVVHALEAWRDSLQTLDIDFYAWNFPALGWKMKHQGKTYPGEVLIGKLATS